MRGDVFFEEVLSAPSLSRMHPEVASFFKTYLENEKVLAFGDRYVVNTHFPPYPSRAFDNLIEHLGAVGDAVDRHLFSVTLAVTNRCSYRCWHCYNAGRDQRDTPVPILMGLVEELQGFDVVHVTLTGGEPLLRDDLETVASAFDNRTYLTLNTTGDGLSGARARSLRDSGVFAIGVSLDSADPGEHDRMRGRKGAYGTALKAIQHTYENNLYPYIISVASRDFLAPERFWAFMRLASEAGAREVHLLEPSATGKLAGKSDILLSETERDLILDYQKEVSRDDALPILSSFLYLESPHAFGCGAGLTHLYIDGSGEVCPCNLVPLSFGNVNREPLGRILDRMGRKFQKPRPDCVGRLLSEHFGGGEMPITGEAAVSICDEYLPREHAIPRYFQVRSEAEGEVGEKELTSAYDQIHGFYDEFWLKRAGKPIDDLVGILRLTGTEAVLEAGCGTGYATVLMAGRLTDPASLTAVDISEGMLSEARLRASEEGLEGIRFIQGDALTVLLENGPFDVVFSSWVLGYIPLSPFLMNTAHALSEEGKLAFIVHKENSPYEALEIFSKLVSRDPSVLQKRVAFDFPRDTDHIRDELAAAGLRVEHLSEGKAVFRYGSPDEVLEHLLKSGAGTAYYDALDPERRDSIEADFKESLAGRHRDTDAYEVVHDYIACIAQKSRGI